MSRVTNLYFEHVRKQEGCLCDKCGQYIQNIYTVTYDDIPVQHFGIDCFTKLMKTSNLTEVGKSKLRKLIKDITYLTDYITVWESIHTYEEAVDKQKQLLGKINLNLSVYTEYEAWEDSSFEEFRQFCIDNFGKKKLAEKQVELSKYKGVRF